MKIDSFLKNLVCRLNFQADDMEVRASNRHLFLLLISIFIFTVGLYFSINASTVSLQSLNLNFVLLLVFIMMPLLLVFNGIEFYLSSKLLGGNINFMQALETIIIASAANILPLPGGVIVKISQLKSSGVHYKHGTTLTLFLALNWLSISILYVSFWLLLFKMYLVSLFLILIAGASVYYINAKLNFFYGNKKLTNQLLLNRFILVVLSAINTFICFFALGFNVTFSQASILSISGVLGSSFSIIPSGIGISEGIGVLIGGGIFLGAPIAFMVLSFIRIINLITIIPLALSIIFINKHSYQK